MRNLEGETLASLERETGRSNFQIYKWTKQYLEFGEDALVISTPRVFSFIIPLLNKLVAGSNPAAATILIWPVGQAVKTPPFHGGNTSSSLVRVTTSEQVTLVPIFL